MDEQDGEAISDLATVAARHALELLGDVLEIEAFGVARACAPGLVLEPGDEVLFIARSVARVGHFILAPGSGAAVRYVHPMLLSPLPLITGASPDRAPLWVRTGSVRGNL